MRKVFDKAAIFCLLILFVGCSRIQYVPMETVVRDSIVFTRISIDTVIYKDSIFIDRSRDTIYKYVSSIRTEYRMQHDTAYIERIDTVMVPYPVEREPTVWENVKSDFCFYLLAVIGLVFLYFKVKRVQ